MDIRKTFTTHDLYLSAALMLIGFKLIDLKRDERGRGLFIFEDRPDRSQIVRGYFSGQLSGSFKAFANAWADLKSLVSEMEMEKRDGQRNKQ